MGLSPKGKAAAKPDAANLTSGLASRRIAVDALHEVLVRRKPLEGVLERLVVAAAADDLHPSDLALTRLITATALRRLGQIEDVTGRYLLRTLPEEASRAGLILLTGATQLLFLCTPAHAAIDLAVTLCKATPHTERFAGLVNAVLRKVATEGPAIVAAQDFTKLNTPDWLWKRWVKAYGGETARSIANAHLSEAALDLSVKSDAAGWAERLGGVVTPTGSVRLKSKGRIEALEGFSDGAWWVQDAAAALPVRLLGDVSGKRVADLCAAPGGKTMQLAAAGATVTAVDSSSSRLATLRSNLDRLGLSADVVQADAGDWQPTDLFDAVLLDAPCLATGTIRRHPDLPHLKQLNDLKALAGIQARLLDNAAKMLRPGGTLVYCTCSLEPEEGPEQAAKFLARNANMDVVPVAPSEHGIATEWVSTEGYLRTLPFHLPMKPAELSGLDGFFVARMKRQIIN